MQSLIVPVASGDTCKLVVCGAGCLHDRSSHAELLNCRIFEFQTSTTISRESQAWLCMPALGALPPAGGPCCRRRLAQQVSVVSRERVMSFSAATPANAVELNRAPPPNMHVSLAKLMQCAASNWHAFMGTWCLVATGAATCGLAAATSAPMASADLCLITVPFPPVVVVWHIKLYLLQGMC